MIFCLAGFLSFALVREDGTRRAPRQRVDLQPVRGDVRPLLLRRGDVVYECSRCHRTAQAPERYPRLIAQHAKETVLNHGRNDFCLNCHHQNNRMAYVAHDGSEIPADRPSYLCGQCHGPRYRDWEMGLHGRPSGYWKRGLGESQTLHCIQCHDPHAPRFASLEPLPGPQVRGRPVEGATH